MSRFKEFYQFTFNYAKNPCQKGLDLDMAIAYWNIVLKGKFKFLDIWTKFLKVSYYLDLSLFEVQQFYSFFGIQFMQIEILFYYFCRRTIKDPFPRTLGISCQISPCQSMMTCLTMTRRVLGQCSLTISSNMPALCLALNERLKKAREIERRR